MLKKHYLKLMIRRVEFLGITEREASLACRCFMFFMILLIFLRSLGEPGAAAPGLGLQ